MGDLRLFGFISLACITLLLTQAWQADYGDKPAEAVEALTDNTVNANNAAPVLTPTAPGTSQAQPALQPISNTSAAPSAPIVASQTQASSGQVSIANDVLKLKVNLRGGDIVNSDLLKYPLTLEDSTPITLLDDTKRRFFKAVKNTVFSYPSGPVSTGKFDYKVAQQTANSVTLFWESNNSPGLRLEKTIGFKDNTYEIVVKDKVINQTNGSFKVKSKRELVRVYNEDDHKQGFTQTFTGGVFHNQEDKYEKFNMKELSQGELDRESSQAWGAMIQHYFGTAWVPAEAETNKYYSDGDNNDDGYRYTIGFISNEKEVTAGTVYENTSSLYVGPKTEENLEPVAEGLSLIVDYGIFTPISQPLFKALKFIHSYVGNWGWAIILLTFGIKLLFFYPSQISYKSMAKMRQAQPQMEAIRNRFKDDRQRQGKAMMELYKKEKINPASGCLPMLIQMPIFISLYWALLESVELRQAPWALWIKDLSAKDPLYILPLIMGVTMFIQQKLNPQPTDPIQAKMFTYLPVVFTVFFMFFPAGLVLYWITNNILTIAQQWYIYKFVVKTK